MSYLLPHLPQSALTALNEAGSTPLHWIALNYHLGTLRLVCPHLERAAFDIKNAKGKTAVQEAEEACEAFIVPADEQQQQPQSQQDGPGASGGAGQSAASSARAKERVRREVVVGYLLQCMGLGVKKASASGEAEGEGEGEGEEATTTVTASASAEEQAEMDRLAKEAERLRLEGKLATP